MRFARCIAGAALISTTMGCFSPSPIVQLAPSYPNVIWQQGRAVAWIEHSGMRVATAFDRQDDDMLGLAVEVANLGDAALEVDPGSFTFTTCRGETLGSCKPTRAVFGPEQMLAELDRRASLARAGQAAGVVFAVVLVSALAAAAVASEDDHHRSHDCDWDDGPSAPDLFIPDSGPSLEQQQADNRQFWALAGLRRTTIAPGATVGGLVYVPLDVRARYVWLHVRALDQWLSFRFTQTDAVTLAEDRVWGR